MSECTGNFKGGRRKELQQEIDSLDVQISNMKRRLSSIVKEYKFDSVQAFYKELNAAKKEKHDYETTLADWEKTYGGKAVDSASIREKLQQKEQIVREREAGKIHQTRKKYKGTRYQEINNGILLQERAEAGAFMRHLWRTLKAPCHIIIWKLLHYY